MATTIMLKEYDDVDGCIECVHFEKFELPSSDPKDVMALLAQGDYSEGDEKRHDIPGPTCGGITRPMAGATQPWRDRAII